MSFFTRLSERAEAVQSLLCVGLDPHPTDLVAQSADAAGDFCYRLIKATYKSAAAFKPNSAFFEIYGPEGIRILQQVIASVPENIPVILDAKRGDIASTALAYAKAVFETMDADAVTISPYLGHDSIEPFLNDPERGVFLLCKTSNPGAGDLQDTLIRDNSEFSDPKADHHLYERVAKLATEWNKNDNIGLVVGATQIESLQRVRNAAPNLWILAPGVGVQGGDLQKALLAGLRKDGQGLLVPISRDISHAADPGRTADDRRQQINQARQTMEPGTRIYPVAKANELEMAKKSQLADGLLKAGCIKFGRFTLKSGLISPFYIDLRQLVSFPELLEQVSAAYSHLLKELTFDRLAGIPYAALPIATAISLLSHWPMIYPRKEAKSYGTKAEIEGIFHEGEKVIIIDDLTTTGESKFEAIDKLKSAGLDVEDVVVLIDRQSGARETLSKAGYKLHAVITLSELLDYYDRSGQVSIENLEAARNFLSTHP